jgi:hypothetical protein
MKNNTRQRFDSYIARQAHINNVSASHISTRFNVDPAVQQRLENATQESSEFLKKINVLGVDEQEGEKVLISASGPIARTNNTSDENTPRTPASVHELDADRYRCEQVNYDTYIKYSQLDAWAGHKDFQKRISQQITRRIALDRIMTGFNRIAFRTRNGDSAGAWNKWGEIYHTQNKPTAGDVGAVNKTGDTMAGRLTVNSDGSAIMIKPVSAATSSFIISQDANGVNNWYIGYGSTNNNNLSIYNYKADAGITIAETITLGRNVSVTGTITPSSYPNFDARYQAKGSYTPAGEAYTKAESNTRFITAVRFGASAIFSERSNTERMAGGVMTSWQDSGSSNYSFRLRPLQYLLNGAWVTAAYA